MRIRLWKSYDVKKAEKKMWKHILKNWIKFNFKHSPNSAYTMDSKNNLSGNIVEVFCNCGECFHKNSEWQ